jgi:hypothetical protein
MNRTVSLTIALLALFLVAQAAYAGPVTQPMKWSQPIYQIGEDPTGAGIYYGWDQPSYKSTDGVIGPQVADDWLCRDHLPVTDFHWWGSYVNWRQPLPPTPAQPLGFWFGIYSDVPAVPGADFSHPGDLLWQTTVYQYEEKFVGWDVEVPDPGAPPTDATFQYNVYLPRTDWFYQPGDNTILWLSIQAILPNTPPAYEWGWKTRPHFFQDDAVYATATGGWQPIYGPDGLSWDMAFEISTVPEPGSLAALSTGLIGLVGLIIRRRR